MARTHGKLWVSKFSALIALSSFTLIAMSPASAQNRWSGITAASHLSNGYPIYKCDVSLSSAQGEIFSLTYYAQANQSSFAMYFYTKKDKIKLNVNGVKEFRTDGGTYHPPLEFYNNGRLVGAIGSNQLNLDGYDQEKGAKWGVYYSSGTNSANSDFILRLFSESSLDMRFGGVSLATWNLAGGDEVMRALKNDCPRPAKERYDQQLAAFKKADEAARPEREAREARERAEAEAYAAERAARRRADNVAAMGVMLNGINSMGNAMVARSQPRPAMPVYSTPTIATPPAAYAGTYNRPVTAAAFGPLPANVGTMAQRQFWAQRCQNQPNDGSSAARGCEQTRGSLGAASAAATRTGPIQPLNVGGLSTNGGMSESAGTARGVATPTAQCLTVRPISKPSLGLWEVVNSCNFRITGTVWFGNDLSTKAGFSMGPGGTDGILPPPKGVTSYRTRSCKTEEWNKGICTLN